MRLKFREERIKRLEQVASGKLSAEAHLLQEKENLVKELEVLRGQLDRNPEITKFAMENLQLKEELRRLALLSILWCSLNGCGLVWLLVKNNWFLNRSLFEIAISRYPVIFNVLLTFPVTSTLLNILLCDTTHFFVCDWWQGVTDSWIFYCLK